MSLFGWIILGTMPWMAVLCIKDLRSRRLPNLWVLPMSGIALLVRLLLMGWEGMFSGLIGGTLCGCFLLLPFLLKSAGAGDVKLLVTCGCWVGITETALFLFLVALIGFVTALLFLLFRKATWRRLVYRVKRFRDKDSNREGTQSGASIQKDERGRMPFAFPIALGFYGTLFCAGGVL